MLELMWDYFYNSEILLNLIQAFLCRLDSNSPLFFSASQSARTEGCNENHTQIPFHNHCTKMCGCEENLLSIMGEHLNVFSYNVLLDRYV